MKKKLGILLALVCLATLAFAQEAPSIKFSVGGGAYLDIGIPMWENADGAVVGVGGYGFFDFTYAEIDAGIGYYRLTDDKIYGAALTTGLLLKYPFEFGKFAIFPAAGIRLTVPLTMSYDGDSVDGFETKDHLRFGFQGGFGVDLPLGKSLFLRTTALCNFDLFAPGENPNDETFYSIGPVIKIGVGYKF